MRLSSTKHLGQLKVKTFGQRVLRCYPHRYIYYTAFCNLADYSASVFPVTAVNPAVDFKVAPHEFRNETDRSIYEMCKSRRCKCVMLQALSPFDRQTSRSCSATHPFRCRWLDARMKRRR